MGKYDLFTTLLYKGETTYGTNSTPDTAVGSVQTINENNANNFIYTIGNNRTIQQAIYGGYSSTIGGSFFLHDFAFLRHFVGPLTGNGLAQGTAYTLTTGDYSSVSSTVGIQAFSLEVGDTITDSKTIYTGCMGNDFTINFNEGNLLSCSFNIIAQKPTDSSTATAYTEPTTLPWHYSLATFKWGATPSEFTQLISGSLSYTNNLIIHYGAGNGRFIRQPITSSVGIKFNLTIRATSDTYQTFRNNFYGASNTPEPGTTNISPTADLEFKIELSEGSGAGLRNADIWIDDCVIETISKPVNVAGGDNLVDFSIAGTAFSARNSVFVQWWTGTRT